MKRIICLIVCLNLSQSCINNEIPECKCVNGRIKVDIDLNKKYNYNQNTGEDSNNLSTTSIKNRKISEDNVIRTTETPYNNDAIKLHFSSLIQLKPNLIKEKTSFR